MVASLQEGPNGPCLLLFTPLSPPTCTMVNPCDQKQVAGAMACHFGDSVMEDIMASSMLPQITGSGKKQVPHLEQLHGEA